MLAMVDTSEKCKCEVLHVEGELCQPEKEGVIFNPLQF